jgi:hypothetical protein
LNEKIAQKEAKERKHGRSGLHLPNVKNGSSERENVLFIEGVRGYKNRVSVAAKIKPKRWNHNFARTEGPRTFLFSPLSAHQVASSTHLPCVHPVITIIQAQSISSGKCPHINEKL